LAKLTTTNSEARRLIVQGGLEINGEKIKDYNLELDLTKEYILKAGKHKFCKVKSK